MSEGVSKRDGTKKIHNGIVKSAHLLFSTAKCSQCLSRIALFSSEMIVIRKNFNENDDI